MTVYNQIIKILNEISGVESICPKSQLQQDLALDSLQMVTLLIEIEEVFQIKLNESDLNPFSLMTVQDVMNLVERYVDQNEENC